MTYPSLNRLLIFSFAPLSLLLIGGTNTCRADNSQLLAPPPIHRYGDRAVADSEGPYFDLPVIYNSKVKNWIRFFQGPGRNDYKIWLDRSYRYLPRITPVLVNQGLPRDLAYLAMIESGFSQFAVSQADAVGPWQFMKSTAQHYGLHVDWWIDERRDIVKSTVAAAAYLNHLHHMFHSWYLAAAAYNMGERRVKNLIHRYHTDNYWILSKKREFPTETEQYIPKLIAAMLIAKAPGLYGFRDLSPLPPERYDVFYAPGGTDLETLALYLGLPRHALTRLNPEIVKGFIPHFVHGFRIRLPQGERAKARRFAESRLVMSD